MNRSLNLLGLLHSAYPVLIFSFVLMAWATEVQGEMSQSTFHPPELPKSQLKLKQFWSPRVCSVASESSSSLKATESCPIEEAKLWSSILAGASGQPFGFDLSGVLKKN